MRNINRGAARRAFSLVELLVVMFIIALVVAILVPALGKARNVGRKAATETLIQNINQGAASFATDNQSRLPGYFSPREMGIADNATRGMSGMENILLDLAPGGVVGTGPNRPAQYASDADLIAVCPCNDTNKQVWVKTTLIGTSKDKSYIQLNEKNYVAQVAGTQQVGVAGHTAPDELTPQLKDLVDSWGTPLLAWVADDTANGQITQITDFARDDSSTATGARYYWNSNSAFLKATASGKMGKNQNDNSLLGGGANATDRAMSLAGILGSPSSPLDTSRSQPDQILPAAGRGKMIFQSAGIDGVFLSRDDKGAKQESARSNFNQRRVVYGWNFRNPNDSSFWMDSSGKPKSQDVSQDFDDLFQSYAD